MTWIELYTQREYEHILYLISQYEQDQYSFAGFLSDMDQALNIWDKVAEATDWADPFLDQWSALEHIYTRKPARGSVDQSTQQLITLMINDLKDRVRRRTERYYYEAMLNTAAAYRQNRITWYDLDSDLTGIAERLDDLIPGQYDWLLTELSRLDKTRAITRFEGTIQSILATIQA